MRHPHSTHKAVVTRYSDRVDVARIVIDARVLDSTGQPILGLDAEDFAVTLDKRPVNVESATWVGAGAAAGDGPAAAPDLPGAEFIPRGRLLGRKGTVLARTAARAW